MQAYTIRLTLNGERVSASVDPSTLLVDLIRDHFGLKGTKVGCDIGVCGLCTILLDGAPVSACIMPAVLADEHTVWTVEGLAAQTPSVPDETSLFHRLQREFIQHEGLQCGICTPGQLVSAYALLRRNPHPTDEEINDWISGNLCRCTGSLSIKRAIRSAAGEDVTDSNAIL